MIEYPARRDPRRLPMHPGALLREDVLPALGRNKKEIAELLGVSRQILHDILREKQPVTPAMALRLGKLCGNGPTLWLNLQRSVDLWKEEHRLARKLARIPTLEVEQPSEAIDTRDLKQNFRRGHAPAAASK
jgi:antitoxin HigA-1